MTSLTQTLKSFVKKDESLYYIEKKPRIHLVQNIHEFF
jgi:hypothetical protein